MVTEDFRTRNLWLLLVCVPLTTVSLYLFFAMLVRGNIKSIFLTTKYLLVPASFGPTVLTQHILGPRPAHAVTLTLCSWLATELVCHLIKITARRMRPAISMASQLRGVKRCFPSLQVLVIENETAFQSFPSGDAGAAAVYSYVLVQYGYSWCWVLFVLSAFGRVYFQAHHVLDTLIGGFLGYICTKMMIRYYGLDSGLTAFHSSVCMVLFVLFHLACRKFLRFQIPAEFRVGVSLYGTTNKN
mmetsp:Transcript_9242/g.17462  ORF Transcript_9242/g.17462 Transcript_9242/m.17462 type:complete len:243 (+) Transcript_9242:145-873(+)